MLSYLMIGNGELLSFSQITLICDINVELILPVRFILAFGKRHTDLKLMASSTSQTFVAFSAQLR